MYLNLILAGSDARYRTVSPWFLGLRGLAESVAASMVLTMLFVDEGILCGSVRTDPQPTCCLITLSEHCFLSITSFV